MIVYLKGKEIQIDVEDIPLISKHKWCISTIGYVVETKNNCRLRLHRLVLNAPKGSIVDHINQNKLDNRKENLRFVNKSQNALNSKLHVENRTGYKGVFYYRNKNGNKYLAYVNKNYRRKYLGYYKTAEEAAKARKDYCELQNIFS